MEAFDIFSAAQKAKQAAPVLANLSTAEKNAFLNTLASILEQQRDSILDANRQDLARGEKEGLSAPMLDRLALSEEGIYALAQAVRFIANQADPVGDVSQLTRQPNGLQVGKMRIPIGVIGMIYESRPNVTIDAAALCFKAGNCVILRGGKEALNSNLALADCLHQALNEHGLDKACVTVIPDTDRAVMQQMLGLNQFIDLLIPRGGENLIRFVSENSRIPVIQHFKGVCHLYVDETVDLPMALRLLENGKTQRTGVCNSLETLLVHADVAERFLSKAAVMFAQHKVKVHACEQSIKYFDNAIPATEADWDTEYLALEISIKVVEDFERAIEHIQQHSSGHTEVIATDSHQRAQAFLKQVQSAVVMVNASSRFSDGGQLGLGAEIGISTSKLHAYGPMGVASLTTEKFVVLGEGQIRS